MTINARRDTFKLPDRKDNKEIAFDVWSVDMCDNSINVANCGLSEISASEQQKINNLIVELLPRDGQNNKVLKTTDLIEHEIELLHNARPVKQRYHPVSEKMQKAMCEQLDKLNEAEIVEKSHSAWNNPIVMGKEIARRIGAEIKPTSFKNAVMANGSSEPIEGEITVPLGIAGVSKKVEILVIPGIPTDFILGLDLVRLFGMTFNARRDTFKLPDRKDDKEIAFDVWSVDMCDNSINVASCG
ncbi:hypothetical protein TSAR_009970, partial [Trichomalopsis sarcophagae]